MGGRDKLGNWETYTLLYIKYNNIPYSTESSTQYSVITCMGKESKKRVATCITDSLCCTAGTKNIVSQLYSQ